MSITEDTVAAIASATGGAIGIIRMSGKDAFAIAEAHFRPWPSQPTPRHLYHGWWHDRDDAVVDEALIVLMPGPHSYTGEDVVELHVHGGALGLSRCLDVCLDAGASPAGPGEFTRRAFLNGRMDLTRAEGVADLISAQTDRALAQARALLKGELRERAHQIREALLTLRARIEVNIDFVEEDVPLMSHDVLIEEARTITLELEALAGTYELGRLVREGARIVIVGRPNAGKSSLFNALIRVDRAIVTDVAGTTRDTLEEKIDLGGIPVILVDTAGLRQTPELVEKLGVERTLEEVRRADLILHVIDGADPEPETPLLPKDLPIVTASSKADLERPEPSQKTHAFSSTTGEGLAELLEICRQRLGGHLDEGSGLILTRKRQQVAVSRAAQAISDAIGALKDHAPTELACVDIQEALDALAELVGTTSIEDVLDHLFSKFCIGK